MGDYVSDQSANFSRQGHLLSAESDREWKQHGSKSKKYDSEKDLIDISLWDSVKEELVKTTIYKMASFYFSILFAVIFIVSLICLALGYEFPRYNGSNESAADIISFVLDKWFGYSRSVTGNSYAITLLVAFLSQANFSFVLVRKRQEYVRAISRVTTLTEGSRQIYPGTATFQFSFGTEGFRIKGSNVSMHISWDAVSPFFPVLPLVARKVSRWGLSHFEHELAASIEGATHAMVVLDTAMGKQRIKTEYIVVPRSFFDEGGSLDSAEWTEFVSKIPDYRSAFATAKQPRVAVVH